MDTGRGALLNTGVCWGVGGLGSYIREWRDWGGITGEIPNVGVGGMEAANHYGT